MFDWDWKIENKDYLQKTIERCRRQEIILPTFNELKHPETISKSIQEKLENIDLLEIHPLNLFRINWRNDPQTGSIGGINFLEIPKEITGVKARIVGLVGKFFPTGAHKVGATYGCLAPYLVSGKMNPEYHKAVWPSTGNYCRGGAFNSALLSVHAVAILPEEMSKERFEWLKNLSHIRFGRMGKRFEEKVNTKILEAVEKGEKAPIVKPQQPERPDDAFLSRLDALKIWRKNAARKMQVESDVILPRQLMEMIAESGPRSIPELSDLLAGSPWRMARFGPQILKAVKG